VAGDSIRDRLSALSRAELLGLAVVVVVTLGGAGLWYVRSLPRAVDVEAGLRPDSTGASPVASPGAPAEASPSGEPILVDVAGWVRRPGVYEFDDGQRVIDAIRAAGGARHGAGLDALNLAAPLVDGTQILVPGPGGESDTSGTSTAAGGTTTIDINTASASELESLPGIGEVIAQRIVDFRTQNGPFASVDDLLDVSGIGDAILAEIRDLVTV
jgi:competence protein ComEA